jgi:hypothetical protein
VRRGTSFRRKARAWRRDSPGHSVTRTVERSHVTHVHSHSPGFSDPHRPDHAQPCDSPGVRTGDVARGAGHAADDGRAPPHHRHRGGGGGRRLAHRVARPALGRRAHVDRRLGPWPRAARGLVRRAAGQPQAHLRLRAAGDPERAGERRAPAGHHRLHRGRGPRAAEAPDPGEPRAHGARGDRRSSARTSGDGVPPLRALAEHPERVPPRAGGCALQRRGPGGGQR